MRRSTLIAAAAAAAMLVAGQAGAQPAQGGVGATGPWMMGPGYGPGMMGPGMMGYGPGMMGGYGPGMGPWMMGPGYGPGMMGPGMMGGYGPGMMGWGWRGGAQQDLNLSTKDVSDYLERWLAVSGNTRLRVGSVRQVDGDTISATIVTKDRGGLVHSFEVDRHTGMMSEVGG